MIRNRFVFLVAGLLTFSRESLAEQVFENAHDLMTEAITKGRAAGVMHGEIVKKFAEQFHSDSPLLVEAKVIKSYAQGGCKRLQVNYTLRNVDTPKGRTTAHLNTELNYCLDGQPPLSLD